MDWEVLVRLCFGSGILEVPEHAERVSPMAFFGCDADQHCWER